MVKSEIEKVRAVFEGIGAGNADRATEHIDPKHYVQHDLRAADGVEGLRRFIAESPREELPLNLVRAFQDGPYVFTQAKGQRSGQGVFFDVFRFENGLVVEQWAFSAPNAPPNASGHTQFDGPKEASHLEDTERNKAFMRDYYQTFHIDGDHRQAERYFDGDRCVRHEPGVRDGVAAFLRDVGELMRHRTIDEIKLLLGQGDFVFIAAQGTHEGASCVYVDLYRVEGGKIVEHWGFPETVPPRGEWKNDNGML